MTDTIMFDLDGTLLQFSQEEFIGAYFAELSKVFHKLGMDPKASIEAVWVGTKAMMKGGGDELNTQRFWQGFAQHLGLNAERRNVVEAACDSFYQNEFNAVKSVLRPNDTAKRLVRKMASKGYGLVLATNPLFPLCAVESRLGWAGLESRDFRLVTHYANSKFCKPNPGYYREIFTRINKTPDCCLMVGNNPAEDMSVGVLGAQTYLVTDCLENEAGEDITQYRRGTLKEMEIYLTSLPDI